VALSNGELHRLLLARALMLDPGLLLLDEPFAGLDTHNRQALMEILDSLPPGRHRRGAVHRAARPAPQQSAT